MAIQRPFYFASTVRILADFFYCILVLPLVVALPLTLEEGPVRLGDAGVEDGPGQCLLSFGRPAALALHQELRDCPWPRSGRWPASCRCSSPCHTTKAVGAPPSPQLSHITVTGLLFHFVEVLVEEVDSTKIKK